MPVLSLGAQRAAPGRRIDRPGRGGQHLLALIAAALAVLGSANARADLYSDVVEHPGRSADDIRRDQLDHPAEVLRLAGIRRGMAVADFLAGDGYYSELLSYLVGPKGRVYLLNNDAWEEWSDR